MSEIPSAHQPIPFLKSDEEQIGKIRRQLEGVFRELDLVHDVIVVCDIAAHAEINIASHGDVDLGDAVPHVIRRCATNRLYTAMKTLTQIVERFGGKTEMSDESLRPSHSRLISHQGDTAGASFEAAGYLSARPLPPSGDLATERVGKNTHRLTTQDRNDWTIEDDRRAFDG